MNDARDQGSPEGRTAGFVPEDLDSMIIALPLLAMFDDGTERDPYDIVIDLNLEYPGGKEAARDQIRELVRDAVASKGQTPDQGIDSGKTAASGQYIFATLDEEVIRELVRLDTERAEGLKARAVFHVWPDFRVKALITNSIRTVKADAAHVSFSALGRDVVWAVLDSGIARHPHFEKHENFALDEALAHRDFTKNDGDPFVDDFGHGTHVAGIIAGECADSTGKLVGVRRYRNEQNAVVSEPKPLEHISGMAPQCKLLNLKVLDENGGGLTSNIMAALQYIQELNGYGRRLRVHGVNLSVGYEFEPEWFACGQSPLCVEVDHLVRSGVVVVVAAGNTGYGWQKVPNRVVAAGLDLTINDPGNAERAITVGATHRDMPHIYGVSYFSSKGPTGDGRPKPDLIAPGERIMSCAAGRRLAESGVVEPDKAVYVEDSGTSMAAPHVSGVVAGFLSIRNEFIGRPDRIKEIFTSTATDLRRDRSFQGHGLVDVMRAIQSV
ncbi:MAG: S8 family peptidase [Actinomycetota bacterium]